MGNRGTGQREEGKKKKKIGTKPLSIALDPSGLLVR